ELGIIFLLFTIGMDFSLDKISQIKRYAILGGSLQVGLTVTVVTIVSMALGLPLSKSIFIGFLVSFSSTAIVLRILQEKKQLDSLHGRTALGILIFQDLAVVVVILLTPLLAGSNSTAFENWPMLFGLGIGLVVFTLLSGRWIVPELLHYIARFKRRDLFLLTIIVICFGTTWMTSSLGLSPALGAFLAGLIISNTEYKHQALGNILPFQDIFLSLFFISIGMLLNIGFLMENLLLIILLTLAVVLLKSIIAGIVTAILGLSFRVMVLVGLMLSQIGEFSFILAAVGMQYHIIDDPFFQLILCVTILTMSLTPFFRGKAHQISDFLEMALPVPKRILNGAYSIPQPREAPPEDHLIIVGFGVNGKNMARAAFQASIPYLVVDLNPQIVRKKKETGEPIYYGDASQSTVLNQLNIAEARVMVVAISDPVGSRKIVDIAKKMNPNLYIIVRTRYIYEMEELHSLGADEVIPEEFETSVEIFSRVMNQYHLPQDKISEFINEIRSDEYEMFRTLSNWEINTGSVNDALTDLQVSSFTVEEDIKTGRSMSKRSRSDPHCCGQKRCYHKRIGR
ncbi:MAG TPA: cation:proton antiporter, partial [Methanobacterium sp.]|nr:cation:proton antiporter [Methanobacterium sp.]